MKAPTQNQEQRFDQSRAFAEGWGVIGRRIVRMEYGPVVRGEHTTGVPVFPDDAGALEHVSSLAKQGSPYHRSALKEQHIV